MPRAEVRDLVVVVPGIMGSTLAQNGELVWAPSAGAALRAIATLGRSIGALTLRADIGDDAPHDGVEPVALMPDLHVIPGVWTPVTGYDALLVELRQRFTLNDNPERGPVNLLPVPYDWRLSNRFNGARLKGIVEPALERWAASVARNRDAQLVFICHSMGGLVAKWYIERQGGYRHTRRLITMGTPYRGAMKAVDQLVNGVRKGWGPLKRDFTAFTRSLPAVYQLLPEYACVESSGGLAKTTEVSLPHLERERLVDAMRFHEELEGTPDEIANAYEIHPLVGFRQPTVTTGRVNSATGKVELFRTIEGEDETGDGTVPRLAAAPRGFKPTQSVGFAQEHGSLQADAAVIDQIEFLLTARPVVHRAGPEIQVGVGVEDVVLAGEPIEVEATLDDPRGVALMAVVHNEAGRQVDMAQLELSSDGLRVRLDPQPPGAYRVEVRGIDRTRVASVTRTVLVAPDED
jgi:Lecithin:cholesterol acyltransferase